jgi:integrase
LTFPAILLPDTSISDRSKAKNATINRELAALKRMFHLVHRTTPPKVNRIPAFPRLAEDNIRPGFLEDGQYEKLFASCPENWFRAIVEVGKTYGWRVGEFLSMRVSQVDLLARTIRLEPGTTKNRDGREVTLTRRGHELLKLCVFGKTAEKSVFTRSNASQSAIFVAHGRKLVRKPESPVCCSTTFAERQHATCETLESQTAWL